MIIKENNKINNKSIYRYYSDNNFYVKKENSEDLVNEVVSETEINVIETQEKIEQPVEEEVKEVE